LLRPVEGDRICANAQRTAIPNHHHRLDHDKVLTGEQTPLRRATIRIALTIAPFRLLCAFSLAASLTLPAIGQGTPSESQQTSYLRSLAALQPIDAHAHVQKSDADFTAMLERWKLHL